MNTDVNAVPIGSADAEQPGAADQHNSDEAKARARQSRAAPWALLAIIPILYTISVIPELGTTVVGWGKLNATFFQLASLLVSPATAILGIIVAERFVDRGPKRLARLGGILALIALVPIFMWDYDVLWPLYLGCGTTLAAEALIIGSSFWVFAISSGALKPSKVGARRPMNLLLVFALMVCAGAALGFGISSVKEAIRNNGVLFPYRVLQDVFDDDKAYYGVGSVAYSTDGQVLTAVEITHSNGVRQERVWVWRTSDWQRVGTLEPGQTQATISWDPQTKLVAERTDRGSKMSLRAANGDVLHTVNLSGNGGKLRPGYSFSASADFGGGGSLTIPSGQVIKMSSNGLRSDSTHPYGNHMFFDYAPDGQYIAAAYEFGAVWIWKLP